MNATPVESRRSVWAGRIALALLLAVGIGVHVFAATCAQYRANTDFSIGGLMAKHMAARTEFPVFFYGQGYMGSVEPGVAALLGMVFGFSPLVTPLGTVALAAVFLVLIYLWGRDASGSRWGGIAALSLCVVGNGVYYYYTSGALIGYTSTLVFGSAVVWLANRIAGQALRSERLAPVDCLLMGAAAGLGWWANQLIVVFYMPAAISLLIGLRGRIWRLGMWLALGAFFVASMPWWVWNITHHWGTFAFGGSLGRTPLVEGLGYLAVTILPFAGVAGWSAGSVARGLVYAAALVAWALITARSLRRWPVQEQALHLLAPWFAALALLVLFSISHYAPLCEVRYLMPLYPVLAVAVGVLVAWLRQRLRFGLAWVPVLVLLWPHRLAFEDALQRRAQNLALWDQAIELAAWAAKQDIPVFFGVYRDHWINYVVDEKICVTELNYERYAPYAVRTELADRFAVLNDALGFNVFRLTSGTTGSVARVGGYRLAYDLTPPPLDWQYLTKERIRALGQADGRDVTTNLLDDDLDTQLSFLDPPFDRPAELTYQLAAPTAVSGVRMLSRDDRYPAGIAVDVSDDGTQWREIVPAAPSTPYFWSGPRLFYGGLFYVQEYRWPAVTASFLRLRLPTSYGMAVSEIMLLEQQISPTMAPPPLVVSELVGLLEQRGIDQLYANRWLGGRVHAATGGRIRTPHARLFERTVNQPPLPQDNAALELELGPRTAFIVAGPDAPRARRLLLSQGISMRETPLGAWIVFDFAPDQWRAEFRRATRMYWTEYGPFAGKQLYAKRRAAQLYGEAAKALATPGTDPANAFADLRLALELYPHYQPALDLLAQWADRGATDGDPGSLLQELARQVVPDQPCAVRFRHGFQLLGVNVAPIAVVPGQAVEMTWFWRCPPQAKPWQWAVFVHFQAGQRRFQDDHVLLGNIPAQDLAFQPFPEIFTATRTVVVPADTAPGEYKIWCGLYDRVTGKRLRLSTDDTHRDQAVQLPVSLRVMPQGSSAGPAP